MVDKKYTVVYLDNGLSGYNMTDSVHFSWAIKQSEFEYVQANNFSGCKSRLNDSVCASILGVNGVTRLKTDPTIDLGKAALLTDYTRAIVKNIDTCVNNAIIALNVIEKFRHWKRTKVVLTSDKNAIKDTTKHRLFIMSRAWAHNPIALSLYTSIIREFISVTECENNKLQKNLKDMKDPFSLLEVLAASQTNGPYNRDDVSYLKSFVNTRAHRVYLNNNHKNLFARKAKDNFSAHIYSHMHNPGIQSWSTQTQEQRRDPPWSLWKNIHDLKEEEKKKEKKKEIK